MEQFFQTIVQKISAVVITALLFFGIEAPPLYLIPPGLGVIETKTAAEATPGKSAEKLGATSTITTEKNQNKKETATDTKPETPTQHSSGIPDKTSVPNPPTEIELTLPFPEIPKIVVPPIETSVLNKKAREAVVNIFCLSKGGGFFQPASGSGVIIDPRGIILTNAHVAQYFLVKNYPIPDYIDCIIRTGSPAKPAYRGELLYIPKKWVEENSANLKNESSEGIGEYDFALIRIATSTDPSRPLPDTFAFIEPHKNISAAKREDYVLAASYPAGFLSGFSITKDLWLSSSVTQIKDLYTFHNGTPDLIAIQNIIGAQEGASGGAIIDFTEGKLLGIIVTRTSGDTTGERELRALSMSHINGIFEEFSQETIEAFLAGDIEKKAKEFSSSTAPLLSKILTNELEKK